MMFALPVSYHTLDWWGRKQVREQYVAEQQGLCHHCQAPLGEQPPDHIRRKKINWGLFPKNFLQHPVHLHHNHNTGLTIGAVHALCNAVLWQYYGE